MGYCIYIIDKNKTMLCKHKKNKRLKKKQLKCKKKQII